MIGIFLAVREKQRQIVRDSLVNPLVSITGPADNVSPPLMRHFVEGTMFGEMLLPCLRKARALLCGCRQKGIRRNIEQAWPALAKGAGNLRHAQFLKREWPAEGFIETN